MLVRTLFHTDTSLSLCLFDGSGHVRKIGTDRETFEKAVGGTDTHFRQPPSPSKSDDTVELPVPVMS